jgi:hypothetical protein
MDETRENPRYTIWRALHPNLPLYMMIGWIRENVVNYERETGNKVVSNQKEFTAWMVKKYEGEISYES